MFFSENRKALVVRRVLISSDHAGIELRLALGAYLESIGCTVVDYGCDPCCSAADYPDYVHDVVHNVSSTSFGVLVCGTGIGMSIAANRNRNIRAALCLSPLFARLAREHNDANVLCLGSRYVEFDTAKEVLHTFVTTKFLEGRHVARVMKLM